MSPAFGANAFNNNAAVNRAFESMLRGGLIRGALVPILGLVQRREFGDRHTLRRRSFQHVLAAISRQELDRPPCKARRRRPGVGLKLGWVEGAFADEDHVGRHVVLLSCWPV